MKKTTVALKDGTPVIGDLFEDDEYQKIKEIFSAWLKINKLLQALGGRGLNVPDVVSEGIYCYLFKAVRTNGTARSYDAVDVATGEGVQVKSTSISDDLTSFGPRSTWDKLIFMDFAPSGVVDGRVDIYEIKSDLSTFVLNRRNNETFADQQRQGRRPRLSIKGQIINPEGLKPIRTISLVDNLNQSVVVEPEI